MDHELVHPNCLDMEKSCRIRLSQGANRSAPVGSRSRPKGILMLISIEKDRFASAEHYSLDQCAESDGELSLMGSPFPELSIRPFQVVWRNGRVDHRRRGRA